MFETWSKILRPPIGYFTAIAFGTLTTVVYPELAYVVALLTRPDFSGGISASLSLLSGVAIGTPIVLRFRYRLRGPFAVMATVLLFRHVLVPVFGFEGDGTPAFALAVATAPLYFIGYVLIIGLGLWVR